MPSVRGIARVRLSPASIQQAWVWSAAILAIIIFAIDTFTPLETAVAVFYVIVIHLAASASRREYLVATTVGCVALTVGSYAVVHGLVEPGAPMIRMIVSLSAIGITSTLALRNHAGEAKLREQANLLELTHDAILVRDMNDTIAYWNRGAEELYGWSRDEAIGRRAAELLRTRFPAPPDAIGAALLKQARWEGELVHTAKDGRQIVAASRWSLQRDKDGRPLAVLETNTDITQRTQVEADLQRTQSALTHAARVATLGELSASIAHEVNQPLAAIVTNGEAAVRWLSRDPPDLGEARDALGRTIQDSRRASEVIRRIRSLSKKSDHKRAMIDLNDVLAESLALLQREIGAHGVAVQLHLAERLDAIVADRIQLQQVVMNLLMNAMQAMDGVASAQRRLVVRSFMDEERAIRAEVEDSGVGFDDEAAKHLFNAFFTTKDTGMGIGLSICRSIVEAHGGRIWASRNAGPGATFHLSLPSGGPR
jgi:two-component system sensor kinase FixL